MENSEKTAIVRLAKKGLTYDAIEQKTGRCRATIAKILKEKSALKSEIKYQPEREKILKLYNKHGDYQKVADIMGLNYSKVYYHLRGLI